jgi:hypothetical protein
MPTKPKPKKKKRLKPRALVEAERDARDVLAKAERDAHDRVAEALSDQQLLYSRALAGQPGGDILDQHLHAAVVRGARRAVNRAVAQPWVQLSERLRRGVSLTVSRPYDSELRQGLRPEKLHKSLRSEKTRKTWALQRMDELVNSVPARQASRSVASELNDKWSAEKIRAWWLRARKLKR